MSEAKPNIQLWDVDNLVPYERNVKKHPKEQIKRIAESLVKFGWNQPISVDRDGSIIGGHGRRLAVLYIIENNLQIPRWPDRSKVPVWVRDDLSDEEVRALRLADNRVAESQIDTAMFQLELADLEFDLVGIFDAKELDFAVADLGEIDEAGFSTDIDAAIDEQAQETKSTAAAVLTKRVPIARVFGIKDIAGGNQIAISRLLATIEAKTGKKGEEALVAFADLVE